jgi:hypothetical protein
MKKGLVMILTLGTLFSCNRKPDSTTTASDTNSTPGTTSENSPLTGCFRFAERKDSAFLHIESADSVVNGTLRFQLFEKDKNEGVFTGKMHGDTLFATYTFMSEGVQSVREVAFLKQTPSGWIEGFGETTERANAMIFRDKSRVDFSKGLNFAKVSCPEN